MKKVLSTTLLSCSLLAFTTSYAHAQESNSIKPESLESSNTPTINNNADVEQFLQNNAQSLVNQSSKTKQETINKEAFKQYNVIDKQQDKTGVTHYALKPKVNDVTSEGTTIKVHVNNKGNITLINGNVDKPYIKVENEAKLSSANAENKAFEAIGKAKSDVKNIKSYPVVSKNNLDINSDKQRLVYDIELNYISPKVAHWKIQVDATTGEILTKQNVIKNATTEGKGTGVNGDEKQPLSVTKANGSYSLLDTSQDAVIETKTANETTNAYSPITNDSNNFNKEDQRAGVDAHYYAKEVYNYFLNKHDRNSYDNNGGDIDSVVHYDKSFNNAAWTGQYMIYGDGDGQTFKALSGANDIVAHELTHAVTERTAGLEYSHQSGALNESFSDVFGYFVDSDDWLLGEDVYTPNKDGDALRSLKNPEQYNQPAHMDQYLQGSQDSGGVHTNSGIPNKAAYLTINAIGQEKAEQIYYLALTQYLTPNAQFSDAKASLKEASNHLYGTNSETSKAIEKAWTDVGVN
ncbi:zinc metalloprotease [Staphylococcus sp. OJ82]|uniref:M4 family metallopeptidase n=1 Tax=Staphylococcus TaxID=1279 RepID=UPI000281EB39|nr:MULTISPECIES: M4 family metallopeptidase [Staphylococcus]EJX17636.1 zinc metalloprotease [Staphylococcus sp. OJ82]QPT00490.1 peptidase M4 family protein [Staphylococcus equorum]